MSQLLWEQLIKLIAQRMGFCIRQQDTPYFKHKIEERIKKLKLNNLGDYYNLLKEVSPQNNLSIEQKKIAREEWEVLANIITNGESFFFRDRGQFNLLAKTIFPEIIASKREAYQKGKLSYLTLKIWSAGCSTGEEVYSLAMLISELIPDPAKWHIVIIGTDINQKFINLAREGIYKQWSFRLTEPLLKTKYFLPDRQNWQIKPHLKSMVTFYRDNLVDIKNVSHHSYELDLVLCRNVFIYFDLDSIIKAVTKIAGTLRYGGYLISGHAELQAIKLHDFQPISFSESIVYKYLGNGQNNISSLERDVIRKNAIFKLDSPLKQPDNHLDLEQKQLTIPVKSVKNSSENSQSSQYDLEQINSFLEQGKYERVIEQAQQLISQQIKNKELYYFLAQAYANKGNLVEAKNNCDRALQLDSMYIAPLFLLAQIAEEENNYNKTKQLLKRIIYLKPLTVDAYLHLGAIYHNEKDLKRSKKMYQSAYDLLKESTKNDNISYQGQTKVNELLTQIKHKL
jgi:chemotaxis protein methyltransferase CheR